MSEIEVPMESLTEQIQEAADHATGSDKTFMNTGALIAALLAVAAAVSALFAGHLANEVLLEQIQASDKWAHYQAKSIKASIAELKRGDTATNADEKIAQYKEEQQELQKEAQEKEHESRVHLSQHESFAAAVTFFQIAIAITAIGVLTRKRSFFAGSIGLGLLGLIWIARAL